VALDVFISHRSALSSDYMSEANHLLLCESHEKQKKQRETCCAVKKVVLFVSRKTSRKWCKSLSPSSNLQKRVVSVPLLVKRIH